MAVNTLVVLAISCSGVLMATRCLFGRHAKSKRSDDAKGAGVLAKATSAKKPQDTIAAMIGLLKDGDRAAEEEATASLEESAEDARNLDVIRERGGIGPLVRVLSTGSEAAQANAAGVIWKLSRNSHNQAAIGADGGLAPLLGILQRGSKEAQAKALPALGNLAILERNENIIREAGGIPALVGFLGEAHTPGFQKSAMIALRHLTNGSEKSRVACRESGAIKPLLKLVREGSQEVPNYAMGTLANLAIDSKSSDSIRDEGGIPLLIRILEEGTEDAQLQVALALRNLAANPKNQDLIRDEGGIEPLVGLLMGGPTAQTFAASALRNLAFYNSRNQEVIYNQGGVDLLVKVRKESTSREAQTHAAAALSHIVKTDAGAQLDNVHTNEDLELVSRGTGMRWQQIHLIMVMASSALSLGMYFAVDAILFSRVNAFLRKQPFLAL